MKKLLFCVIAFILAASIAHADSYSGGGGSTPTLDEVLTEGASSSVKITLGGTTALTFLSDYGIDEFYIGKKTGVGSYDGIFMDYDSASTLGSAIQINPYYGSAGVYPLRLYRADTNDFVMYLQGGKGAIQYGVPGSFSYAYPVIKANIANAIANGYILELHSGSYGDGENNGIYIKQDSDQGYLYNALEAGCRSNDSTEPCVDVYHEYIGTADSDMVSLKYDFVPSTSSKTRQGSILNIFADSDEGAYATITYDVNMIEMYATATLSGDMIKANNVGTGQFIDYSDNGSPVFSVENDGSVVATGGISFGAGGDEIDAYDEGTWTPTYDGVTTGDCATGTVSVGKYTRIGNTVHADINISVSSCAIAPTGTTRISLPITSSSLSGYKAACSVGYLHQYTLTANNIMTINIPESSGYALLYQYPFTGGASTVAPADINGWVGVFSCDYLID